MAELRPLAFSCSATIARPASAILDEILDLSRWPEFRGWGPLPGIASASFRRRCAGEIGTEIAVTNLDGSCHVERIARWSPVDGAELVMSEFSPPLSRLATRFVESWAFEPVDGATRVTRSFALHPTGTLGRVALSVVRVLLERAVARHLAQMAASQS